MLVRVQKNVIRLMQCGLLMRHWIELYDLIAQIHTPSTLHSNLHYFAPDIVSVLLSGKVWTAANGRFGLRLEPPFIFAQEHIRFIKCSGTSSHDMGRPLTAHQPIQSMAALENIEPPSPNNMPPSKPVWKSFWFIGSICFAIVVVIVVLVDIIVNEVISNGNKQQADANSTGAILYSNSTST